MASSNSPNVRDILKKYSARIESRVQTQMDGNSNWSSQYRKFREEMIPVIGKYEKWGKSLGGLIKLKVSDKDRLEMKKNLDAAHIDLEPWQALNLGVISFLSIFFIGLIGSVAVALIKANKAGGDFLSAAASSFPFLFFFLILILGLFIFYFAKEYPKRLAAKWRLKASSQMVPAILYVVVYMRHTPNLERAISFASNHLQYPLALDFKKIFYNVEVGKYSTIKESLDAYLQQWRDFSPEFIEAFHLIESSLFEPGESRRINTLEKSLQVVLDGVYEKMLKFTHNVKSPLTNVYMLGVVLPTLGLALLPLASAMLGGALSWTVVLVLFNMIIPFMVFFMVEKTLALRPGGYGESQLLERNPLYFKYVDKSVYIKAFLICLPFFILGLLPLIFQYTPLPQVFGWQTDATFSDIGIGFLGNERIFNFIDVGDGEVTGPFGIGALILSMLIPLGVALFFVIAYGAQTKEIIKNREKTKSLETEFNSSLFQLGNRVGNGVPPELVFGKVAESTRGLKTEDFFKRVNYNIRQLGMSVEKAIFDRNRGAINYYPSDLIATSMRVLIESSKKGLKIAAVSLMSISEYVKNIQKITQRLKDMLAEIISDMKSNMTFLAPLLSGIVVGLSAMITAILAKLSNLFNSGELPETSQFSDILSIFKVETMLPPYFLQIIVGVYLVQIVFILTSALVTVDSGEDKLQKTYLTGKNLRKSIMLYFIIALGATLALYILTIVVLGNML